MAALPIDEVQWRQMLQRELKLSRDLVKLYRGAAGHMQARIAILEQEIRHVEIETATGKLFTTARLEALIAQVQQEILALSPHAAQTTAAAKSANITAAAQDSLQLMKRVNVDLTFNRLPVNALRQYAAYSADGTPLAHLFSQISGELGDGLRQTLFNGMAEGRGPRQIARMLVKTVEELPRARALLIARTESLRAYRESSIQFYDADTTGVIDGWVWSATPGPGTCAFCLGMDGTVHPKSEQFGSHPSCRCRPLPHTVIDEGHGLGRQTGTEWFEKQPDSYQKQLLGPAKYKLYSDGHITLDDLTDIKQTKWGPTGGVKSIKALVEEGTISEKQALSALKRTA